MSSPMEGIQTGPAQSPFVSITARFDNLPVTPSEEYFSLFWESNSEIKKINMTAYYLWMLNSY